MTHWLVGIDENGLGPRLGPLVVTGVLASAADDRAKERASKKARGKLAECLGDSKGLVAFGKSTLGEAWARAALSNRGSHSEHPRALVDAISLYDTSFLRDLCPGKKSPELTHLEEQCWGVSGETFGATEEEMSAAVAGVKQLEKHGIVVHEVRSAILCTSRLNRIQSQGRTRLLADLGAMEELLVHFRGTAESDIEAVCGKVGGYDRYGAHFTKLSNYLHTPLEEKRRCASYKFHGLGTVSFVQDADASNMLVGLASLVGKWVRDLLMDRIVRYYQDAVPELPRASGYHDPVTTRFIKATSLIRKDRAMPMDCFERVNVMRERTDLPLPETPLADASLPGSAVVDATPA